MGPIEDVDWDDWVRAIEINLFGSVLMCRAVLPHFKAQRYGKIMQLSGGGATNPLPRISAYAASKAAIVRFAETLARGGARRRHRRELHRARRAQHAPARRGARGRARDRSAQAFYERIAEAEAAGRHAARQGRRAGRLPRLGGERRHHRQADQRRVGSVGDAAASTATTCDATDIYTLRRIVPADRGMTWGDEVSHRRRHRRLRPDRPEARAGARPARGSSPAPTSIASAPRRWPRTSGGRVATTTGAQAIDRADVDIVDRRDDQRRAGARSRAAARRGGQARARREAGRAHRRASSTAVIEAAARARRAGARRLQPPLPPGAAEGARARRRRRARRR